MNAVVIDAVTMGWIALALTVAAVWSWRRGRRAVGSVLGVAGALWVCVAVRNLPDPIIVAGLLGVAGAVALATVWPLFRPGNRAEGSAASGRWPR